jgi:hypothetical protein
MVFISPYPSIDYKLLKGRVRAFYIVYSPLPPSTMLGRYSIDTCLRKLMNFVLDEYVSRYFRVWKNYNQDSCFSLKIFKELSLL